MTKCQNSQRNDPFCGPKTHVPEELAVRTIAPLVARDSVASGSIGYERVIDAFASNLDFRDANALCTGGAGYERAFEATSVLQADSVLPPACGVDEVREKGACARGGWHKGRHKGLCLQHLCCRQTPFCRPPAVLTKCAKRERALEAGGTRGGTRDCACNFVSAREIWGDGFAPGLIAHKSGWQATNGSVCRLERSFQ
jgi:hypothetical protein